MIRTKSLKKMLVNMKLARKNPVSTLNELPINDYVLISGINDVMEIRTISGYRYFIDNPESFGIIETCILFDDFAKIVSKLKSDTIQIESKLIEDPEDPKNEIRILSIQSGKLSFQLAAKDADIDLFILNREVNTIADNVPVKAIEFNYDELVKELDFIYSATDKNPTKGFINYTNGILFNFHNQGLDIVGTDGRRLNKTVIMKNETIENPSAFLIPVNHIEILLKLKAKNNPKVNFLLFDIDNEKIAILKVENNYLATIPLLDTPFPDYPKVIPSEFEYTHETSANAILDIIDPLAIISNKDTGMEMVQVKANGNLEFITTDFNSNRANAIVDSKELVRNHNLRSSNDNPDCSIFHYAVNINYMKDAISQFKDNTIHISGSGSLQPITYTSPNFENRISVLMPVRCPEINS